MWSELEGSVVGTTGIFSLTTWIRGHWSPINWSRGWISSEFSLGLFTWTPAISDPPAEVSLDPGIQANSPGLWWLWLLILHIASRKTIVYVFRKLQESKSFLWEDGPTSRFNFNAIIRVNLGQRLQGNCFPWMDSMNTWGPGIGRDQFLGLV